ncbi:MULTISPECIES: TetR/AcrR family transcriptional regulator [unclassified Microbacterium]|uniref:TetR/AcrR family transcriptional regulator n=1 Tax=unclassified Microbacterium TaxID=2609290 RepID=UPI00097F43D3|nr:TetR/AcrR family transcriptional regulator [Microbacterium sp. JB110]RCS62807.1 TetR/AcrR family transcriptional regulator [Microbacterium sp. JB110]SJM62492.1 Transcriptional regulator, TetR family [Frigoribacterium sp. JB110]
MARTVDPRRHEERRLHIIDAALTVMAARGYERATTAAICREARIGSGTFFHYFPAKVDLLLAILELGADDVAQLRAAVEDIEDPLAAISRIVDQLIDDASDPRLGGFVRAVAAVMTEPKVAAALEADERAQRELLLEWLVRGQSTGQVRTDLPAERLVSWVRLLMDGFLEQIAADSEFTAEQEGPMLREAVRGVLTGFVQTPGARACASHGG